MWSNTNTAPQCWKEDRKSTRLNSSHRCISYAVFCLKKYKKRQRAETRCRAKILCQSSFTSHIHVRCSFLFFFNDTATTEIYTLSLHDALPIWPNLRRPSVHAHILPSACSSKNIRSEEHTSELQSRRDLVCRLLLEKKKNYYYYSDGSCYNPRYILPRSTCSVSCH